MRKTKIICTLGPATENEQVFKEMMLAGMDVARFNFSHGDHEEQGHRFDMLLKLRKELGLPIAALLDTKGPEIRLRTFENGRVELQEGQLFTLTTKEVVGNESIVSVSFKELADDVSEGMTILLDDGLVAMTVEKVTKTDVICKVKNPGEISDKKSVNIPGANLSMPFISPKDYDDIVYGIERGFDFIAASFTRTAEDILEIRRIFQEKGCQTINIIAKIENMQGVENIDEIIRVSDGIMVARGDMGVEIPLEEVPALQKMIIRKVYDAGKQVITATQMLESMMKNPRPTRAEATDVANAIYDGTSAIMLSGETAAGMYPLESIKTMVRIAEKTEEDINYQARFKQRDNTYKPDITNAISHATCTTAMDLGASAIITVSKSGKTARMISKYRPECPIIAFCMDDHICRQLNLSWGVTPMVLAEEKDTDNLFDHAVDTAQKAGLVEQGDLAVLTAGVPLGISGTTNLIKVHVVGHILIKGKGLSNKTVCAPLCVCKSKEDLKKNFKQGDIIVIKKTDNDMLPEIKTAAGLIVEEGGANSHASIVGLSLDIPVILGAEHAIEILKSGAVVRIEGEKGIVCSTDSQK